MVTIDNSTVVEIKNVWNCMDERNVNIHNLKRAYAWLGNQLPQNVHKPRNEGLSKRTSTKLVAEMLEEFKEMNNGAKKEIRKKRNRWAGKKVTKKKKMREEGNERKLVWNKKEHKKYMQVIRDGKVKKQQ